MSDMPLLVFSRTKKATVSGISAQTKVVLRLEDVSGSLVRVQDWGTRLEIGRTFFVEFYMVLKCTSNTESSLAIEGTAGSFPACVGNFSDANQAKGLSWKEPLNRVGQ